MISTIKTALNDRTFDYGQISVTSTKYTISFPSKLYRNFLAFTKSANFSRFRDYVYRARTRNFRSVWSHVCYTTTSSFDATELLLLVRSGRVEWARVWASDQRARILSEFLVSVVVLRVFLSACVWCFYLYQVLMCFWMGCKLLVRCVCALFRIAQNNKYLKKRAASYK